MEGYILPYAPKLHKKSQQDDSLTGSKFLDLFILLAILHKINNNEKTLFQNHTNAILSHLSFLYMYLIMNTILLIIFIL